MRALGGLAVPDAKSSTSSCAPERLRTYRTNKPQSPPQGDRDAHKHSERTTASAVGVERGPTRCKEVRPKAPTRGEDARGPRSLRPSLKPASGRPTNSNPQTAHARGPKRPTRAAKGDSRAQEARIGEPTTPATAPQAAWKPPKTRRAQDPCTSATSRVPNRPQEAPHRHHNARPEVARASPRPQSPLKEPVRAPATHPEASRRAPNGTNPIGIYDGLRK